MRNEEMKMAKVNLKNVRVCFLKIWERDTPKQDGQKPAYRAVILLDKEDPQVDKVEAAARAVLTDKLKSEKNADKWMDRHYAQDSKECAVRDGDERDEVTEEFEGMLYINAKSFKQPNIQTSLGEKQTEQGLTIDGDEIEGQEIYSGCYCNVSLDIWAWNNTNGKGLGAGLMGLRFRDDGDSFGGGGSSCSDDDLGDAMTKMKHRARLRSPNVVMTMTKMKHRARLRSPNVVMTKTRTTTTKTKHHVNVAAVKGKAHYSSPLIAGFLLGQ
ncbi:hypothetical protein 22664B1_061 [Escherichia phage vB_EcoS-22664B1]|nr:hypothetical protein 22664B1_061 [Escherichia phage vB_EcoS-22664B1]